MSLLTDLTYSAINSAQLHVVLTAPDGTRLYIPVSAPQPGAPGEGGFLWPQGFKISVAIGNPPQLPNVTTDKTSFILSNSWELFRGWLTSTL